MEEYLADFEKLALKYSVLKIEQALDSLRIKAGQKFFPKPDEVAEEIELKREQGIYAADNAAAIHRREREQAEYARNAPWRQRLIASGMTASEFIAFEDAQAQKSA